MKDSYFESSFAKNCKFHWDFIKNFEDKDRWDILAEQYLDSREIDESLVDLIPKKIHQIWIGSKPLPNKYKKWMKTWQSINKDWEYKLWTDLDIKKMELFNQKAYNSSSNVGFKSDILRYEILNKYGGLYIDTDLECVRKIPNYLRKFDFISCIIFDKTPQIANGFIMSRPNGDLTSLLLKSIQVPKNNRSAFEILNCSGPNFLTNKYFSLEAKKRKKILILPSDYFYPLPNFLLNTKIEKKEYLTEKTIGIHYWEVSWMKGNLIQRIINKLSKQAKKIRKKLKN